MSIQRPDETMPIKKKSMKPVVLTYNYISLAVCMKFS